MKRCLFCIDATAELADFACGDAWVDRYLQDAFAWSIVLARSAAAEDVLRQMSSRGELKCDPISPEEVIRSQRSNLQSKKRRQRKRMALCRLLGVRVPVWDTQLPDHGSYASEIKALVGKVLKAGRAW
jgi:coenzyme F420 hydrogenase subunit beta